MRTTFITSLENFRNDERGLVTHFALTILILLILFAGLSVDSSNAWRVRSIMQTAADAAAQGGIMDLPDETTALETALALAGDNLDPISSGFAVTSSDIEFGSWDTSARSFTSGGSPTNAMRVTATRSSENNHPVQTFFLRLVALTSWDIQVQSVAYRSTADCATADISTNAKFELDSDTNFYNGFCVEAAGSVKMDNDSTFDDNNIIYVDTLDHVDLPGSSSMSSVVGRGTATSSASLTYGDIFQVKSDISAPYKTDIASVAANYLDPFYSGQPDYINKSAAVIQIDAQDVKYTSFTPGRIYGVVCGDGHGEKAQFYKKSEISNVVIVSECKIQLGKESYFKNVVFVSESTNDKSVYASSKVQLGADDDCAAGGGVSIFAAGGFKTSSDFEAYGLTISTAKKVDISAKSDSIAGITINAGQDVKIAANGSFGTCKSSTSDAANASYLLVQ